MVIKKKDRLELESEQVLETSNACVKLTGKIVIKKLH